MGTPEPETTARSVLIVEDRDSLRRMLAEAMAGEGYAVETAASAEAAKKILDEGCFDLVLTDLKLPGADGLSVVSAARSCSPQPAVIVMTGYGTVQKAVEAMKLGAIDFLEKPVELDDLFRLLASTLGQGDTGGDRFEVPGAPTIIGRHPSLRAALRLLERVAPRPSTVLLTGESGTGKELFARAIHACSPRRDRPFVAINCAAIPESLIENELFGHEKGAFTGADRRQKGRFELASGGTLFLDEIGELAQAVQGKVLRVIEERRFERVGSGVTLKADVRLVAATNRDLAEMAETGLFRRDLYYRLEVFPITLPSLRDRRTDIPLLARYLLETAAGRHRVAVPVLEPDALDLLMSRPWPGNVRQLANVLERAVILAEGGRLRGPDLERYLEPLQVADPGEERQEVLAALEAVDGDKQAAANRLGISYRTLQRRLDHLGLKAYPYH